MNKKHFLIYLLPVLIIALAAAAAILFRPAGRSNQPAGNKTKNMTEEKINRLADGGCLATWTIGRALSIPEIRGRRQAEGEIIKAKEINPEKYTPLYAQAGANWKINPPDLFYLDKEQKEMVADGQYFSDLTVVNAVDLPRDKEPQLIGKFFADDFA